MVFEKANKKCLTFVILFENMLRMMSQYGNSYRLRTPDSPACRIPPANPALQCQCHTLRRKHF